MEEAGNKLVVIDFFATWCGPCQALAPRFEELAKELKGEVVFLKVDVDESHEISGEYDIRAMPTLVFIRNKEELERNHGDLDGPIERLKDVPHEEEVSAVHHVSDKVSYILSVIFVACWLTPFPYVFDFPRLTSRLNWKPPGTNWLSPTSMRHGVVHASSMRPYMRTSQRK